MSKKKTYSFMLVIFVLARLKGCALISFTLAVSLFFLGSFILLMRWLHSAHFHTNRVSLARSANTLNFYSFSGCFEPFFGETENYLSPVREAVDSFDGTIGDTRYNRLVDS